MQGNRSNRISGLVVGYIVAIDVVREIPAVFSDLGRTCFLQARASVWLARAPQGARPICNYMLPFMMERFNVQMNDSVSTEEA